MGSGVLKFLQLGLRLQYLPNSDSQVPATSLHVNFTLMASGICLKPRSSNATSFLPRWHQGCSKALLELWLSSHAQQQWPFEFIWIPDQGFNGVVF